MAARGEKQSHGYDVRTDALLDRLGNDLTEQDFADLALACADQAGCSLNEQNRIAAIVNGRGSKAQIDSPVLS
jgi:hypothetical protein